MEATAVSLARTVLDGVLGGAGSAVADEAALLLGVRREVDFIRDELEMMRSFLMATSGCAGDTARTWVKQVRDLAYDVEDCLLDFMLLQALSRPIWRMPETLAARYRVAARIRELKASVEELNQRNQRYNVVAAAGGVDSGPAPPPPHDEHLRFRSSGAFQESQDIGRGDEKRELIDLIDSGDAAGRRVVSVWAMGGMGKSSVARSVYNDPDLIDHFDCRAWVTVPHPLELDGVDEFKRRLGKQLGTANEQKDGGGEQKRHLIVVDDLRSLEEWGHIEPCLFEGVAGGLVIVTTRQRDVARHCAGGVEKNAYELKPLAHPHGMKLLCQKVYKNAEHTLPPHMLEEANKILGRCHGLPLAIATIGGLLGNRPKTSVEWMNLRIHLGSELEFNRDINSVITSSYDGLPYHLKSCFLYLSIFPENHEIRCTRLLRRWIAEGYITKRRDMTVEEVGQMHLNELMNRSMIRPMKKKIGASMAVERCQVHGVVLQIILSKSIEENQLFIIDKHCNEVPQSKIRHLVVTRWNGSEEKMTNINLSRVRSLTVFGECPVSLISPKLRLLRVLDLEDAVDLKNDDLMHIGDLYHLRYLGLRGTKISRLPSSLQNLKYLETLDVQDTKVTHLPDGTAKLEKLRYLLAGINFAEDLAEKMQENNAENNAAKSNANLLETFADLLCRCCHGSSEYHESSFSCFAGQFSVRAPEGIEKLRNLHMLGVVHIEQGSGVAQKLGKLTNLRRLGVDLDANTEEVKELCKSIQTLVRLERLEVRSSSLQFLEGLNTTAPKHLLSLRLYGHLGRLPVWISSLNDLAKIKLLQTKLQQEDIDLIGNLHNLVSLGLWGKSFAGESLHFHSGMFKTLKSLHIEGLEKIKTLDIENGAMPGLEKLRVKKCSTLSDSKDGLSGVPFLLNLSELSLISSGDKPQLEKILQRQISGFVKRPKLLIGKSMAVRSPNGNTNVNGNNTVFGHSNSFEFSFSNR
ncbi:disease resistance protein PIK6-NP-like [Oryza brachyantha]|uniref:disease resistance protein PIK6-NP-like n=1 Tax=Oryza brachyantha TaxID=4533 RepID=UPI001ADB4D62|nr:disease resistance protein PIK6-NP-like [Oryza brachyantha]